MPRANSVYEQLRKAISKLKVNLLFLLNAQTDICLFSGDEDAGFYGF